jgi:hypothetical protein
MTLLRDIVVLPNSRVPQSFVNCCFSLGQILTSATETSEGALKRRTLDKNVLALIFEVLNDHPDDPQVVQYVHFLAGNLTFVCTLGTEVLALGAINLSVPCLQRYSGNPVVLCDVVFFLKNVAFETEGRKRLREKGIVKEILGTMARGRTNPELIDLCANLLFDMTFDGKFNDASFNNVI